MKFRKHSVLTTVEIYLFSFTALVVSLGMWREEQNTILAFSYSILPHQKNDNRQGR